MQERQVRSLGREDPLEKGMATHSSILAWRIPRTEEPGGLHSMGVPKSQIQLSDFHLYGNCKDFIEVLFEVRDGRRQMVGWDDKESLLCGVLCTVISFGRRGKA